MTNSRAPSYDGWNEGATAGETSEPDAQSDGPLVTSEQPEASSEADAASPYPWNEVGEQDLATEADTGAAETDDLPQAEQVVEPAGDRFGTVKALLDGRALETIPIMEYVWERTNRVLVDEELLRGRE